MVDPTRANIPAAAKISPQPNGVWVDRIKVDGTREYFQLDRDPERARRLSLEIRARLRAGAAVSAVRTFLRQMAEHPELVPPAKPAPLSPLVYLFLAHEGAAPPGSPKIQYRARWAMLNLVQVVQRDELELAPRPWARHTLTLADFDDVLWADCSILARRNTYAQFSRVLKADLEHRTDLDNRAVNTAVSEIQYVRGMVNRTALPAYWQAGLRLPSFAAARGKRVVKPRRAAVLAAGDVALNQLYALLDQRADGAEELFYALALPYYLGLMKQDLLALQVDALQDGVLDLPPRHYQSDGRHQAETKGWIRRRMEATQARLRAESAAEVAALEQKRKTTPPYLHPRIDRMIARARKKHFLGPNPARKASEAAALAHRIFPRSAKPLLHLVRQFERFMRTECDTDFNRLQRVLSHVDPASTAAVMKREKCPPAAMARWQKEPGKAAVKAAA